MYDIVIDLAAEDIFIVLEYVDGGTSQAGIDEKTGKAPPLKEQTIWSHMRHLILGLEYLHMQGIVHRDIKPENILMTKPAGKGALGMCKIADFGTSCLCEGDANAQKTAGTPAFFAPELCSMTSSGTYDGRSTDLWAVGVTAYLWVCGRMPFSAPTTMLLMKQISECPAVVPAPKEASSGLKAVIESLMTRDLEKRLTLNQLRLHPWCERAARTRAAPLGCCLRPLLLMPTRAVSGLLATQGDGEWQAAATTAAGDPHRGDCRGAREGLLQSSCHRLSECRRPVRPRSRDGIHRQLEA